VPPRHVFSSADLPEHLSHQARYDLWRDIHYAQVATVEVGISDRPFEATLEAAAIGPLVYAKMSGTINRVTRTAQSIRADLLDKYLLVMNLGTSVIGGTYRTSEVALGTGSAFLDGLQPQHFTGGDDNTWVNLTLPRKLLSDSFARIEDKQGIMIESGNESLTLLRNYLKMLDMAALPTGSGLMDHVAATIVDLVGLATGAKGDEAELAGMRGLRAARLQAILNQIRSNYRNPALSAPLVGLQLGLSARYVQDLLATTGTGFSERILELRLQDAKSMLSDPRYLDKRISEIALDVGFGDISYFNRSFRRRFGCSPKAAR
jgi:AraC-like DNA-binding protein